MPPARGVWRDQIVHPDRLPHYRPTSIRVPEASEPGVQLIEQSVRVGRLDDPLPLPPLQVEPDIPMTYPYGNRFHYGPVLDSLEVERFQFSPDGQAGFVVQYELRNSAGRTRALTIELAVKTDLRPVWFSVQLGVTDAPDTVGWDPTTRTFVARDTGHPWFCVWGATGTVDAQPVAQPQPIPTRGMSKSANVTAFKSVASLLNSKPRRSCRRP